MREIEEGKDPTPMLRGETLAEDETLCFNCGKRITKGIRVCYECGKPVDQEDNLAEAEVQRRGTEFAGEIHIVLRWTDRGVRTKQAQFVHRMKKYLKRAKNKHGKPTGFNSIEERFHGDEWYRESLMAMGWATETIHEADRIAQGDMSAYDVRSSEHRWLYARQQEEDPTQRTTSSLRTARNIARDQRQQQGWVQRASQTSESTTAWWSSQWRGWRW